MSDTTVKTTSNVTFVAEFVDDDTRTITLTNPAPTITQEQLESVQSAAAGVLIGDKSGAAFVRLKSPQTKTTTTTTITF